MRSHLVGIKRNPWPPSRHAPLPPASAPPPHAPCPPTCSPQPVVAPPRTASPRACAAPAAGRQPTGAPARGSSRRARVSAAAAAPLPHARAASQHRHPAHLLGPSPVSRPARARPTGGFEDDCTMLLRASPGLPPAPRSPGLPPAPPRLTWIATSTGAPRMADEKSVSALPSTRDTSTARATYSTVKDTRARSATCTVRAQQSSSIASSPVRAQVSPGTCRLRRWHMRPHALPLSQAAAPPSPPSHPPAPGCCAPGPPGHPWLPARRAPAGPAGGQWGPCTPRQQTGQQAGQPPTTHLPNGCVPAAGQTAGLVTPAPPCTGHSLPLAVHHARGGSFLAQPSQALRQGCQRHSPRGRPGQQPHCAARSPPRSAAELAGAGRTPTAGCAGRWASGPPT